MKKYVFEKNNVMPLCGLDGDNFFKIFTGEVITDDLFIRNGLEKKTLSVKEIKLNLYIIYKYIMPTYDRELVAYLLDINDCINFLDMKKQPLNDIEKNAIIRGLSIGKYNKELLWGDNYE